jgi:hypothetical protein
MRRYRCTEDETWLQQPTTTDMSTNFLSLPSELCNNIYEQLFQEPIWLPYHPPS